MLALWGGSPYVPPMKIKDYNPIAVMAADADDLSVVSSLMQDAVAKVGDFAFVPEDRRFALVANRFVWEEGATRDRGPFHRVRTGAHFDDVKSVRTRALKLEQKDAVVSILSIRFEPGEDGAGTILLDLAGGGAIALEVDAINLTVKDLSAPWRTSHKPRHEDA